MQNPTVFIIEDDSAVAEALIFLFKSVNLPVKYYQSGYDFLQDFNSEYTGCIVLDVRMPDISGLKLQEKLNTLKNKLPIIFITGHGDIEMAVRAMRAGAYDFIIKPFNNQVLLEQVQRAIADNPPDTEAIKIHAQYQTLTQRERQLLQLIVGGMSNKQIGS